MALSVVQVAASQASTSVNFASNVTAGDGVVIIAGTQDPSTFSGGSDTYISTNSGGWINHYMLYVSASTGGYNSINVSTAGFVWYLAAFELSANITLDNYAFTGNQESSNYASGNLILSQPNEVILGFADVFTGGNFSTLPGGYTNATASVPTTTGKIAYGYGITSSPTTVAYDGTLTSSYNWDAGVYGFYSVPVNITVPLVPFQAQIAFNPILPSTARDLIMSIAAMEGSDAFNNFYPEGVGVEGSIGLMNLSPSKNLFSVYGNLHT